MSARTPTRRSRSRSRRSAAPARASRSPSSSAQPLLITGLALGVVVLAIVFVMGKSGKTAGASTGSSPKSENHESAVVQPVADTSPRDKARAGSAPGRPAPTIESSALQEADDFYRQAANLWNEAQTARKAGRTTEFQDKCLASWHVLDKLFKRIESYTDWLEEADLEGWAMPGSYTDLQNRLAKWDGLRIKVKKVKPLDK